MTFRQKVQSLSVVWFVYGGYGALASSLLSGLSGYVDIGLVLLWIQILCTGFLQHLHKVLVLGLICNFRNEVRLSLGDRTRLLPERYDVSCTK